MSRWPCFFTELLEAAKNKQASDVHVGECDRIRVRRSGRLTDLEHPRWQVKHFESLLEHLCSDTQKALFETHRSVDLAYATPDGQRYRINLYRQRGRWALAARILPKEIRDLSSMNLPSVLTEFTRYHSGLVLVTGATGSGKSTTLASMINIINRQRECHILTIEDPVEYQHQDIRSMVHQREVHADTSSYANAVRAALRQDPDVLLIGEMRDLDTMRSAMSAAETGHLVFSTLHTSDSVGAINRIIGSFPAQEQTLVRQQLSLVLRAVVTQRLLPDPEFTQRFPATEILLVNPAVANLIRNNKPEQIYSVMESSRNSGMMTLEQALANLVNQHKVEVSTALAAANNPHGVQRYLSESVDDEALRGASAREGEYAGQGACQDEVPGDKENTWVQSTSVRGKVKAQALETTSRSKKGFTIEPQ